MMSKRNYVIGAREPIGGDRSPRRYRNMSEEYPLPAVRRNGVGKSSEENRSETKRKEAIVTLTIHMFPIPLVMISLFVYRRALLLIQKSITPIILGR